MASCSTSEHSKESPTKMAALAPPALPGYDASADYVVRKLRQAGYKVKRQEFTFPFFRERGSLPNSPSSVRPRPKPIETVDLRLTRAAGTSPARWFRSNGIVIPPTPEPSSASGCDAQRLSRRPPAANSIALIQRGTCNFEDKVANATGSWLRRSDHLQRGPAGS